MTADTKTTQRVGAFHLLRVLLLPWLIAAAFGLLAPGNAQAVVAPPAIIAQPSNSTIAAGANTTFSATASDATGYQWQVNTGSGFTDISNGGVYSGATTATLSITGAPAGMNGYRYRVVATGPTSPDATSDLATLTIGTPPSITAQPSGSTIAAGANTAFSVTASNATSYQWQVNTGAGYTIISNGGVYSGATTATLSITGATADMNGYQYRVVVTGLVSPSATSTSAALTVNSPPAITQHPVASTIGAGGNTIFYVAASNAASYQWQVNTGSGFTDISNGGVYSGANSSVLFITGATAGMNGYVYRAVVTGLVSPSATSTSATLTVIPPPAIDTHPLPITAAVGDSFLFFVAASNVTTYQWQVDTGSGFTDISNGGVYSGANSSVLGITGVTAGMNGYRYRVVATGPASPDATSNAALLTVVFPTPAITAQPSNSTIAAGANTTFSATASNASGYQWQVDTGSGFTDISDSAPYSGATTATLTITGATAAMNGYQYRVVATGLASPDATSDAATLTVNSPTPPSIIIQPMSATTVVRGDASFHVWVSDDTGYGYQWQVDTGSGFTDISNGNFDGVSYVGANMLDFYIFGATAVMNGYQYRVVVTAPDSPDAISDAATLTVNDPPPAIMFQPYNSTTVVGANTAFNVLALDATGYQWQVNDGAGYINISDGGVYSGATTATLTITGATAGMNGYQYRVLVTGLVSPSATSTSATLTVNPAATPTLSSVSPNSGLPAGGNSVTLSGSNFTGATAVTIGGVSATGIVVVSATTITAVAPAHALGAVNVAVTTPGGTATLTNGYTYSAPSMSFTTPPGALDGGTVGMAYSRTVTASGGVPPYVYLVVSGSLPDGLTLDTSTGTISGTPTTVGNTSFDLQVKGADNATLTASFSIAIAEVAPVAGSVSATVAANSSASAITLPLSGGAPISVAIASAASHGTALASGTSVTYMPTAGFSGTDSFTYTATNSAGTSAPATVTITVTAPALGLSPAAGALGGGTTGVAYAGVTIAASGGTSPYGYEVTSGSLPDGLTLDSSTGAISGTPTTAVNASFTITATDANSATGSAGYTLAVTTGTPTVQDQTIVVGDGTTPQDVRLDAGATGGPFDGAELVSVEPANGGRAEIWGDYAPGGPVAPVGWYLKFSPNPAYSGQVRVRFRLTNAVGSSGTGTVTYMLGYDAAKVAQDVDALVHGFVQTRQSMIASTIKVPGLTERRRMGQAMDPLSTRMSPSADGLTLGFATSLAQMQAAGGTASSPFNVWVDGALLAHNREDNGGRWGSFAMVSLGADYLVSEKVLLGLSVHYDRMTDPTDEDAKLTGNGWMAGPYASFEIGSNVFWDTSLLYGGSSNDIDTTLWDGTFDTRRWLFDSSLNGQWQLDDITVLTPRLRAVYFAERVEDYAVRNDGGDEIGLDGFTQEQLRVSLGAEITRSFTLQGGSTLSPKFGATAGFAGLDGSGLFGSVSTGLSLQTVNGWAFDADLLFNIEGEGEKSLGAKVGASRGF